MLESIGDSPDWDDVGELALLSLVSPMDAESSHRVGQGQAKEEKEQFWEVSHVLRCWDITVPLLSSNVLLDYLHFICQQAKAKTS